MASSVLQIWLSSHPSLLFNPALIFPPWLWSDPQGLGGQMRDLVPPKRTNRPATWFLCGGQSDVTNEETTAVQWGRSQRTRLWTQ